MSSDRAGAARNENIDVLRFFAALMIVVVHVLDHTPGAEGLAPFIIGGRSWAVPFFFINSGYLFFQKYESFYPQGVLKMCLRLAVLYGFAVLIYFFLDLGGFLSHSPAYVVKFFITAQPNAGHLWFLVALIFGYCSLLLLSRFLNFFGLGLVCFCIVFFGLLVEPYPYLFNAVSPSTKRFLLLIYPHILSIPFIFFGVVAARYKVEMYFRPWMLVLVAALGIGLSVAEGIVGAKSGPISHFYIGTYVCSIALFLLALSSQKFSGLFFRMAANVGRRYSLLIYVYHLAIINLFGLFVTNAVFGGFLAPIVVNALVVFFGLIFFFYLFEKFFGNGVKLFSGEYLVIRIERLIFGGGKTA